MKAKTSFSFIFIFICFMFLFPHSGRTDKYGGHHNRKTGGYHYHNSGYSSSTVNSYSYNAKAIFKRSDPKILFIQSSLKLLGYDPGPMDGLYGNKTKYAIQLFQRMNSIKVTGYFDYQTKYKLLSKLNEKNF